MLSHLRPRQNALDLLIHGSCGDTSLSNSVGEYQMLTHRQIVIKYIKLLAEANVSAHCIYILLHGHAMDGRIS